MDCLGERKVSIVLFSFPSFDVLLDNMKNKTKKYFWSAVVLHVEKRRVYQERFPDLRMSTYDMFQRGTFPLHF